MSRHFNLFYLLSEDQQANLMDQDAKKRIQKNIEIFYKEIKPPWDAEPPISIGEKNIVKEEPL